MLPVLKQVELYQVHREDMCELRCWVLLSLVHSPDMRCNLIDQQTDQLDSQHMLLFRIETVPDQLDMKHNLFVQSMD
jgi:hypothetical protein